MFWIHYLNINLAKEFGVAQPIFLVTLTATDLASLGEKPTLRSIAACLVGKILATQSQGPYNICGQCIGAILAYEIALQLRAAGHEVSLLVLLDGPSPSYLESYNSMTAKFMRPRHLLARMARLGLRQTLFNLRMRLIRQGSVFSEAQGSIESAAFAYQPERYSGEVLLILASEPPPNGDFLPGWQKIVPQNLHVRYVSGYHRELTTAENVRRIADVIVSRLQSTSGGCLNLAASVTLDVEERILPQTAKSNAI